MYHISKPAQTVTTDAKQQNLRLRFRGWRIIVAIVIVSLLLLFLFAVKKAQFMAHESLCESYIFQLGCRVKDYDWYFDHYPSYLSEQKELWSWRSVMLEPNISPEIKIRREEPWNSAYNLEQLKQYRNDYYFTCPCDYPHEKRASYVAVTGPGTVWTEVNAGRIKNPYENFPRHIIIIETSEPTNHWAEPGDDVSPEEVIRLFQADPGLKRNSKKSFFTKGHWPKHFVRADGSVGDFGQISDVNELRKLLVVHENNFP